MNIRKLYDGLVMDLCTEQDADRRERLSAVIPLVYIRLGQEELATNMQAIDPVTIVAEMNSPENTKRWLAILRDQGIPEEDE